MPDRLSPRLAAVVDALPLWPEARVLGIGCGPGAVARAVASRLTSGHIRATDRSATAIEQALHRIAAVTTGQAQLFVDGGDRLRDLTIPRSA